jgi:hypothetical protein
MEQQRHGDKLTPSESQMSVTGHNKKYVSSLLRFVLAYRIGPVERGNGFFDLLPLATIAM